MTAAPGGTTPPADPFSDLDAYLDLPRVEGLWVSPDGRRLVVGAATPDRERARLVSALWEVDPDGRRPARRLTRSAEGETAAAFTPDGDLLFVSQRPEPDGDDGRPRPALWLQPAAGGDARVVASPGGGVRGVTVGATGTVLLGSAVMPSAADLAGDREVREARRRARVSAILHEEFPVRHWDHDLGPERTRLLVGHLGDGAAGDAALGLRDLTGHVGRALHDESTWDLAPDGRTAVAVWFVAEPGGSQRPTVVAVDTAGGGRRVLADDPDHEYDAPRISPDGTRVAVCVHARATPEHPGDRWLAVVPLAGGEVRPVAAGWDRWPHSARWTPDGSALVVVADDAGRAPLWRVDVATGQPVRLTPDDAAYTDPRVSPDGRWVYALRSAVDSPPAPVRVPLGGGPAQPLPGPAEALGRTPRPPGRLEEVVTAAADGTPLRAWLALPPDATQDSPAPLLLWIHGGPLLSSNAWSWRWNPWLAVARGYAVLQPDYGLSTGYGLDFVLRGWRAPVEVPYGDLMAVADAAQARPDVDAGRTAAMGGSYGGLLSNWVAGHTDRFRAIVTHASVWTMEESVVTADVAHEFRREMTPAHAEAASPHRFADAITTPMLVVHGDRDYRVPFGEALRLWWDLASRSTGDGEEFPHRFLYFPDEGHWILRPNHVRVWYSTVFAFLDQHVRGREWRRPDLLG